MVCHFFLSSMLSSEKCVAIWIILCLISNILVFSHCFQDFLCCLFLTHFFFGIILDEFHSTFWIYKFVSLEKFRKFSGILLWNYFLHQTLSLHFLGLPWHNGRPSVIDFQISGTLFCFEIFSLCCSDWLISMNFCEFLWIYLQVYWLLSPCCHWAHLVSSYFSYFIFSVLKFSSIVLYSFYVFVQTFYSSIGFKIAQDWLLEHYNSCFIVFVR